MRMFLCGGPQWGEGSLSYLVSSHATEYFLLLLLSRLSAVFFKPF